MKFAVLSLLFLAFLFGDEFFNKNIKNKPKGIIRDFYIWQYLQSPNLSSEEINKAYELLNSRNPYLRKTLRSIGLKDNLNQNIKCLNANVHSVLRNSQCLEIVVGNNLIKIRDMHKNLELSNENLNYIMNNLKNKVLSNAIKVLTSKNIQKEIFKSDVKTFLRVFNSINEAEKQIVFQTIDIDNLNRLTKEIEFASVLNYVIINSKMLNFKQAISKLNIQNMPHNTFILLGINELKIGTKTKALEYFKRAEGVASSAFLKNRSLFWQYKTSEDKQYLEKLNKSSFVDIFSIYANQRLKKQHNFKIVSDLSSLNDSAPPFSTKDPYVWQDIVNNMLNTKDSIKLANAIIYFSYKETIPHLAFLMQKINSSVSYFIIPYQNLVKFSSVEEKSLVYAIARQESRFLPTLISRSFALGIMQIMPANVEPFSKDMGIDVNYDDLFDPKIGLNMGKYYINQLKKEYKNPLFIAYAYNGGPGFLRRFLSRKDSFSKNKKYEPWISMELIPYEETRFYGMHVIANYVIYSELFGKEVNLENLLKEVLTN